MASVIPGTPVITGVVRFSDTLIGVDWDQPVVTGGDPTNSGVSRSVNDGAWEDDFAIMTGTTTVLFVATTANQKIVYRVRAWNEVGPSPWSTASSPAYTTPAAPSNLFAVRDASLNVVLTFTRNAYADAQHEVWHGTKTGSTITWDGTALTTLAAGVTSYTHSSPSTGTIHVYRVKAKQGSLVSGFSATVEALNQTAPAKPTILPLSPFADRVATFRLSWVHNPIDGSPQSKYQWRWSSDGGSTWTTGLKTDSTLPYHDYAASTWAANASITFQVRTKGAYDSGSDGDASYSPWSDSVAVTFKTAPTTSITAPATGSTYTGAQLVADVGFAQAEGATFVKTRMQLQDSDGVTIEQFDSTARTGVTFDTTLLNGGSYTVRARVQDSNGLWSAWASSAFSVTFLDPVPAMVTVTYLPENGFAQLDLFIAEPGPGQAAVTLVTVTRAIDGASEPVAVEYPADAAMSFLDTTPTINGTNVYTVTTISAPGARSMVTATLVTAEDKRAFLSKGAAFDTVGVFGANLQVDESLDVATATVEAAGRLNPIGLYGVESRTTLKVKSFIFQRDGFSTIDQLRALLLIPGKACYRDASGRRVFGAVTGGSVAYEKTDRGSFSFTVTETS